MIEDDFYATIKLKNGEEIFAKIAASEEEHDTMIIVSNPIVVSQIKNRAGVVGYSIEPWLKTTTDDMFVVNINDILIMNESSDLEMIMLHQNFTRQTDKEKNNQSKLDRKMGYISNVNDAKEILEKIFKSS
jgi:hypothetical protein|tara:strand:- start:296 stop:688 length:393 start_codon:yes stop_codon:yes gene_type:complete